jgi:hypothetical protein
MQKRLKLLWLPHRFTNGRGAKALRCIMVEGKDGYEVCGRQPGWGAQCAPSFFPYTLVTSPVSQFPHVYLMYREIGYVNDAALCAVLRKGVLKMEASYHKPEEAVNWLERDLEMRCPGAKIEVTIFEGGQSEPKHFEGDLATVMPIVRQTAAHFPQVELQAHPRNVYGQYAMFVCACDEAAWEKCPLKCTSFADRPKITVVVRNNGNNHQRVVHHTAIGHPSAAAGQ